MEKFFTPQSVVVVGASSKENSVGNRLAENITKYSKDVYLINPKGGQVNENEIKLDLSDVPDNIDLGVILIRADLVPLTLTKMADKGIDSVVIGTGGFSEIGEKGEEIEKEVLNIIKERKLTVIGPNCVGLINTHNDLFATFLSFNQVSKGNIGLITQSGAYGAHVADKYPDSAIGFSKIISVGNQMDINIKDSIAYLADDPETDVICVYFESIYEGREFIDICRNTVFSKPIIATAGGHTALGSVAATSHTGALASNSKVLKAALFRAGVIFVDDFDEMFKIAHILADKKIPDSRNVAIITNAGGPGVMITDQIAMKGLGLAELSEETTTRFREYLHPASSVNNPVDMLAGATPADYVKAINLINPDDGVGSAVIIIPPPPIMPMQPFIEAIVPEIEKSPKPIIFYLLGQGQINDNLEYLRDNKILHFTTPETAVNCLKALTEYQEIHRRLSSRAERTFSDTGSKWNSGLGWLEKNELLQSLLIEYGVNTAKLALAVDQEDVIQKANEIGYPVVMKIAASEFTHKTDVGGVVLNIQSDEQLIAEYKLLKEIVERLTGAFDGVFLQQMITTPGQEVIIGAIQDPNFGPMIMFGGGGIEVELYGDVCFGLAPLEDSDIERMLASTFAGKKLNGIRNIPPADINALRKMLQSFSEFIYQTPELAECELNPVIVHQDGKGATAVDFRFSE